jgi:ABC-type nitrate/sulfonate/bicarbonate transport system ATPase subunit
MAPASPFTNRQKLRGDTMIQANNLTRRFGELAVIKDLSFALPERGIVAILGASGCGKTTLLRLLAGLDLPDGGSITSTHRKIAVSFQEPRLVPWLSAKENINFVLSEVENSSDKASELLAAVGLADKENALPRTLSGGEKQRLSLARALAVGADLLLLDEPFSALDEETKRRVLALVKDANPEGLTVVITHDKEDALLLGATALVATGTPFSALVEKHL